MARNSTEPARRAYIRLLSQVSERAEKDELSDTTLLAELIEAKFLTGGVGRGANGIVQAAQETGITVEGRLFLQRLKKEEKEDSLWNKSRIAAGVLLVYIFGLLSSLFTEWLRRLL